MSTAVALVLSYLRVQAWELRLAAAPLLNTSA